MTGSNNCGLWQNKREIHLQNKGILLPNHPLSNVLIFNPGEKIKAMHLSRFFTFNVTEIV